MSKIQIEPRRDRKRGCGWRKPGGLYLMADGPAADCGKLPIPLDVCPTCGGGIKASRGWTWVNGTVLAAGRPCENGSQCTVCPLGRAIGRCGLLWIGGAHYKTPRAWLAEADELGISRRIPAIPRDFILGNTWVMLAHREVILNPDGTKSPAIFHVFRPMAIEYVVREDDPPETLERLVARGVTLVRIERMDDPDGPLIAGMCQPLTLSVKGQTGEAGR